MKKNNAIAFIADGSIKNPILVTQGMPLFNYLAQKGYNTIFITLENINEDIGNLKAYYGNLEKAGVKVIHIKLKPGAINYFSKGFWELKKIVNENKIEILHCRSFFPSMLAYILKKILYHKLKVVFDTRGAFIEEEIFKGHYKKNNIKFRFLKLYEKKMLKYLDSVVVVSKKYREYLIIEYSELNLAEKIYYIPNRIKINDDQKDYKVKPKDFIIGVYSGSTAPWQGFQELLVLIKEGLIKFNNLKIRCILYNIEDLDPSVKNLTKELKNFQIFSMPAAKTYEFLEQSNFGILLRAKHFISEVSSPIKFAEYLYSGCPVLINPGVGDTEEIINDYKVGVIVENEDYSAALEKMFELLKDPNIYDRCRDVAIKEFNIEDSFKDYENIYQKIMN